MIGGAEHRESIVRWRNATVVGVLLSAGIVSLTLLAGRSADHGSVSADRRPATQGHIAPAEAPVAGSGQPTEAPPGVQVAEPEHTSVAEGANSPSTAGAGREVLAGAEVSSDVEERKKKGVRASEILAPEWVGHLSERFCTQGGTCERASRYAIEIATNVSVDDAGGWPAQKEREIDAYIKSVSQAKAIQYHNVLCSREGCLLFVGGDIGVMFGARENFIRFIRELDAQPWTREMRSLGEENFPGYWWESIEPGDYGLLLVFKRK